MEGFVGVVICCLCVDLFCFCFGGIFGLPICFWVLVLVFYLYYARCLGFVYGALLVVVVPNCLVVCIVDGSLCMLNIVYYYL